MAQHRRACDAFTTVLRAVGDRWDAPSPCTEWNALGVLEHVIGFHDRLLLEPLGAKPSRPRDDPVARWEVTVDALFRALARPDSLDEQRTGLLGVLTTDVLVHTWDIAAATGQVVTLDPELCAIGYERAKENLHKFEMSAMFGSPIDVADDAPIQDKVLAIFGRDPRWVPTQRGTPGGD